MSAENCLRQLYALDKDIYSECREGLTSGVFTEKMFTRIAIVKGRGLPLAKPGDSQLSDIKVSTYGKYRFRKKSTEPPLSGWLHTCATCKTRIVSAPQ